MMGPKISTLEIRQFRALRHLKIEGLGRVNLMTGRNNTGKSSVLEALRILASDASPSVIYPNSPFSRGVLRGDRRFGSSIRRGRLVSVVLLVPWLSTILTKT